MTNISNVFYRKLNASVPLIVRGEGVYLYDDKGKRYIDGSGGALVVNVGHGVAEIAEAMAAQARAVAYVNGKHFTNAPVEALAREVAALMPPSLNKAYFLNSGSAATEAAIKLARQYAVESGHPGKYKVIARRPGYHGNTLAALSVSGRPTSKHFYRPLLHDALFIPAPTAYRCPERLSYEAYGDQCAAALEATILREGADTVSAFIAEPIIGASAGAAVPPNGYFQKIRAICTRHDVLFIADEVLTGMGRSGTWLAIENDDVIPDLILLGKGLAGGYAPLSALVATEDIVATLARGSGAFAFGQSFSHTPLCAAAGVATIQYLKRHNLVERCATQGVYLMERLQRLRAFPFVGDIRGQGLMVGIEFVEDRSTKTPFKRSLHVAETVAQTAMRNGLVLWPNAGHLDEGEGDIVLLAPPFIITEAQIDDLVDLLEMTFREVAASMKMTPLGARSKVST